MKHPQPTLDLFGLNNRAPGDPIPRSDGTVVDLRPEPKPRDWVGSRESMFKTLGASNHCDHDRETHDFYASDPAAVEMLLELESFSPRIWEPACGQGHISKVLEAHGHEVVSTDLIDRGYGIGGVDFLSLRPCANELGVRGESHSIPITFPFDGDIITNPPYKFAQEFVETALALVSEGQKVAMFLKTLFLEGKGRRTLFREHPPKRILVSSSRLKCALNGDFDAMGGSCVSYSWFVWEKGFRGDPIIKWFN